MTTQNISVPLELLERWLEESKDLPPVEQLAKVVNQAAGWGVLQAKGMEQKALTAAIQQIALEALDDGIKAAVVMMRSSKDLFPGAKPSQIADLVESTLGYPASAKDMIKNVDMSSISDGYHTFGELYEHRHALFLALMRLLPNHFWLSTRHSDGELCFGKGEWFIAGCNLPGLSGPNQITYHLPISLLNKARATGARELEVGEPWDGHAPEDVVDRLTRWVAG